MRAELLGTLRACLSFSLKRNASRAFYNTNVMTGDDLCARALVGKHTVCSLRQRGSSKTCASGMQHPANLQRQLSYMILARKGEQVTARSAEG